MGRLSDRVRRVRLYPTSRRDRVSLWLGVSGILLAVLEILVLGYTSLLFWMIPTLLVATIVVVYLLQDLPPDSSDDPYQDALKRLRSVEGTLSDIASFLGAESKRVEASKQVVADLKSERTQLETVLGVKREQVEAVLSANNARMAKSVWKERLYGFFSGIAASVAAALILDALTKSH